MTTSRHPGLLSRIRNLIQGLLGTWIQDREGRSPRAVYERAIAQRTRQYTDLKSAVAGVLYMRNKLEAEIRDRRAEVARTQADIRRSVERGNDDTALALIGHRDALRVDLARAERELEEVSGECESAKANLIEFRGEIRGLEREKVRMLATLANASARRRFQEALQGLNVDGEMRALESVREQIAHLQAEGNVDHEIMDRGLESRIQVIRKEARNEAAQRELDELKRAYAPKPLPTLGQELILAQR